MLYLLPFAASNISLNSAEFETFEAANCHYTIPRIYLPIEDLSSREDIDFPTFLCTLEPARAEDVHLRARARKNRGLKRLEQGANLRSNERECGSAANICPGSRTAEPWARGNFSFSRNAWGSLWKLNRSPDRTFHCVRSIISVLNKTFRCPYAMGRVLFVLSLNGPRCPVLLLIKVFEFYLVCLILGFPLTR